MRFLEMSSGTASPRRSPSASSFAFAALAGLALWAGSAGCASQPLRPGDPGIGEALYASRCTGCHRFYQPEEYDRAMWRVIVRRMAPDAGLNPQQREDVLAWLLPRAPETK